MTPEERTQIDDLLDWLDNNADGADDAGALAHDCTRWHPALVAVIAERDRLRVALEALVPLQTHYADLLNQYDGGQRTAFASADEWLARLDELAAKKA